MQLVVCQSWFSADGQHADLPSITLTNIKRGLVASDEHGTSLALKSTEPFSDGPLGGALHTSSPIPLASAFWRSFLFGNPDSLVPSSDATRALQLVSDKLGVPIADGETIDTMRAGQLRKLLRHRFGPADAEQTIAALWRAAPANPDAPAPNEDQSQASPGPRDCPPSMPAWRRELHQEISNEQRLLEGIGWCG